MRIFKNIVEHESSLILQLSECKGTTETVLYGAGELAKWVFCRCEEIGVKICNIAVDREFLRDKGTFNNIPIRNIEDFTNNLAKKFNFIIAFRPNKHIEDVIKRLTPVAYKIISITPFDNNLYIPYNFYENNKKNIEWLFDNLHDDLSKETLISEINYRISGKSEYKKNILSKRIYFPDFLQSNEREVFVDCGAFTGDTIRSFLNQFGRSGAQNKIYAFEPDPENFNALAKNTNDLQSCSIFNKGVWRESGYVKFIMPSNKYDSYICTTDCAHVNETLVETIALDDFHDSDAITFIKMDIEGAELDALKGAQNTIAKNKPKLAICLYHRHTDLINIPKFIKAIRNDYKFYMRSHSLTYLDLVLYAI
jgi:FkbM family methyltransferase